MKFIEVGPLPRINAFLDHVNVGETIVCGNLEAYSCKLAGLDKELCKSLESDLQKGAPEAELATSPVGPLAEANSRKTLVYLILTLNQCYPDYDFTLLRAHHFRKEEGHAAVEPVVDSYLLEVSKVWEQTPGYGGESFLDTLWSAIDEACELQNCDVYSYRTDGAEHDMFDDQNSIWQFNYFFFNWKLKRIVYFCCRNLRKTASKGTTQSTPDASLHTDNTPTNEQGKRDSDSEIVGGMDDVA